MSLGLILALALGLVLLSGIAGIAWLARFLGREPGADETIDFDPLAPPPSYRARLGGFLLRWRAGPPRLTYRRDSRGRFRKIRR